MLLVLSISNSLAAVSIMFNNASVTAAFILVNGVIILMKSRE